MAKPLRQRVWDRANGRCEHCGISQELDVQPFQLDHIRAQKHAGPTTVANLALACLPYNSYKGANVAGYDPQDDDLQPLFNPRYDDWSKHFAWEGSVLRGKTAIGRTTIEVLRINSPERIEHRRLLIEAGPVPIGRTILTQFAPSRGCLAVQEKSRRNMASHMSNCQDRYFTPHLFNQPQYRSMPGGTTQANRFFGPAHRAGH